MIVGLLILVGIFYCRRYGESARFFFMKVKGVVLWLSTSVLWTREETMNVRNREDLLSGS